MSDEKNKNLKAEVKAIESAKSSNAPTMGELLLELAGKVDAYQKQRTAGKSSEQLAREAQVRKVEADKREKQKRESLYATWCRRDTWVLKTEALPLAFGKAPSGDDLVSWLLSSKERALYDLAVSCVGHSLTIVNKDAKQDEWRVTPLNWLRWLQEKRQPVEPEFANALQSRLPGPSADVAEPKTKQANLARGAGKKERLDRLEHFVAAMEEQARKANLGWDRSKIPVTKKEFLDVFYRFNPQARHFRLASFEHDFKTLGVKFKNGVKTNKNNVLTLLFNGVKAV